MADLLWSGQVAALFGVNCATVARWVKSGRLAATRSGGGGQYRFEMAEVRAALERSGYSVAEIDALVIR